MKEAAAAAAQRTNHLPLAREIVPSCTVKEQQRTSSLTSRRAVGGQSRERNEHGKDAPAQHVP